ncbi:MAG: hypothetical protein K5695_11435 [Oscillospiraceae bacterium]|nr:hypothetical protein [Oscillospiraceae bacterium]
MSFRLRLYFAEGAAVETACTALVLEREIYTPYETLTAEFPVGDFHPEQVCRIGLEYDMTEIFLGITDRVVQVLRAGVRMLRIKARSFTSVLVQNELVPGLHANLTIGDLVQGFYTFPHVTYQEDQRTGYIYVTSKTSLWDCIVHFTYKLTGGHAYTVGNMVRMTLPDDPRLVTIPAAVSYGTEYDTTKLVSCYHMEALDGTPDAYVQDNPAAAGTEIVRHKQIPFDRAYLSDPTEALTFRNLYSDRGWRAKFVEYAGFADEQLGEKVTFGAHLQEERICRVRVVFGANGLRTTVWAYEDGFYNV